MHKILYVLGAMLIAIAVWIEVGFVQSIVSIGVAFLVAAFAIWIDID